MTLHRQSCENCGHVNVSKTIPQTNKGGRNNRNNTIQSVASLGDNIFKSYFNAALNRDYTPLQKVGDAVLNIYDWTKPLTKHVTIKQLDLDKLSKYKEIARMYFLIKKISVSKIENHTSCNGNQALSILKAFDKLDYTAVSKGNIRTVTEQGQRFFANVLRMS